jgi:nucleoid-associated protein YgaU
MTQPSQQSKRKGIFQNALDAMTNRDEKAALEAAMKEVDEMEARAEQAERKLADAEQRATQSASKLAEAEKRISALEAELAKTKSELETSRRNFKEAQERGVEMQRKINEANAELRKYAQAGQAQQAAAAQQAAFMAEHTLKADETLSHMALKYYGHATEPYWRLIYEANKDIIGDNPSRVRPGMTIKIPTLPEEMKK